MRSHAMIFLQVVLSIVIVLVVGCVPLIRSTETPSPVSVSTTPETKTPTVTAIPTTAQTITPTAISTLAAEQARQKLLELLSTNGDCQLPCLWGITPGKSTYQEAQAILAPFGSISVLTGFRAQGGSVTPWYTEGDMVLATAVRFLANPDSTQQMISSILFEAEQSKKESSHNRVPIYDSKIFGERLRPYMLPGILSVLGKPSRVELSTLGGEITGTGGFYIVLVYPDQGVLAYYKTQLQIVGAYAKGALPFLL